MGKVKQKLLSFHPCFRASHQIILGDRNLGPRDHRLIQQAEAIILPQTCSCALYQACKNSPAALFPNYDMKFKYPGKVGQVLLFRDFHLPHPVSLPWFSVNEFREFVQRERWLCHPLPFLVKANESHEGEGIFVVSQRETLQAALENLRCWEKTGQSGFISQEIISTEGNVLRAVILGKEIITYWKRREQPSGFATTISRNAKVDKDWRKDLQRKGQAQARALSEKTGINVAAVDFAFSFKDPNPKPLFLEINYYFGRRGLGGLEKYYQLLHKAIQEWLQEKGFDPGAVELV